MLATAASAAAAAPFEIAYEVSGHSEQAWIVSSNGMGRKELGPGEQPLISPNGQMVAASNFGSHGYALFVYSTVGQPARATQRRADRGDGVGLVTRLALIAVQLTDTTPSSTATNPGSGGWRSSTPTRGR